MTRTTRPSLHEVPIGPPTWTRHVGHIALIFGALTWVASGFLAWWLQGIGQTPVSAIEEVGGYVFTGLPVLIIATIALSILAGAHGGRGRRLGITAGTMTLLALPTVFLLGSLLPVRN